MKNKRKIVINLASFLFLMSIFIVPSLSLADEPGIGSAVVTSDTKSSASSTGWSVSNVQGFGLPKGSIKNIATAILQWLLGAIGVIGIIGFAVSGIMYLLSFGDDERMKTAKQAMYYSITGVIVGLVGLVAIQAIDAMLNANNTF